MPPLGHGVTTPRGRRATGLRRMPPPGYCWGVGTWPWPLGHVHALGSMAARTHGRIQLGWLLGTGVQSASSIGLMGASWAIICSGVAGAGITSAFTRISSSSFFLKLRRLRASAAVLAESCAVASHSDLLMARSGSSSQCPSTRDSITIMLHPRFQIVIRF